MLAGSPYIRIADTTSVAGKTYLQLHHMASIATGMCLSWLLFSFFFLPLHCHVVYAHVEQSSQCANRYACKHRLLYVYAYVNYDSTLHKIPNWNQKQGLSDNNKENEPDIINNLCIFVPGAMNRSSQRFWSRRCLIAGCPIGTEYLGAHSAGKTLGPLSVDIWTGSPHY